MMNVQEMEAAVSLGSIVVVLVWLVNAYGLIAWKQQTAFGCQTGLSFGNSGRKALSAAFGWRGYGVARSADRAATLESAFGGIGPSLVFIPIDCRENAPVTRRLVGITCRM